MPSAVVFHRPANKFLRSAVLTVIAGVALAALLGRYMMAIAGRKASTIVIGAH